MPAKKTQHAAPQENTQSVRRRLYPACAFLFALCTLVTVVYSNGHGALPPVEQRYAEAKSELEKLKAGKSDNAKRDAWMRLADEFHAIYILDPKWSNRPAALFRMAESLEELAGRSGTQSDCRSAVAVYEDLALRHAQSRLAGDALLRAAVLKARHLNERTQALRLLERIRTQYAQSSAAQKAADLERELKMQSSGAKKKSGSDKKTGEINRISWKTLDANRVQIIVECDRSVNWQARRMETGNKKSPARLAVDIEDAVPLEQLRGGARVTGSPLTAVRVERGAKERASLLFDFTALARYESRVEHNPFRLIFDIASVPSKNAERQAAKTPAPVLRATAPHDLASQLGLTVQTVFLDAGHGGKDPGTSHNSIVEREVSLDVVRRVGRLLRNNGLGVQYSREKDVYLSLSDRTRSANAAKADIFVSIHVNASPDSQVSGFETYYLDPASNTDAARLATVENAGSDKKMGDLHAVLADFMLSARTQESRRLADMLQRTALIRLDKERHTVRDGGVKSAPLHVLIGTGMPAVLVEVGYCSNAAEARKLASAAYRQALASGIAEGILAYRDRLQRKQRVEAESAQDPS